MEWDRHYRAIREEVRKDATVDVALRDYARHVDSSDVTLEEKTLLLLVGLRADPEEAARAYKQLFDVPPRQSQIMKALSTLDKIFSGIAAPSLPLPSSTAFHDAASGPLAMVQRELMEAYTMAAQSMPIRNRYKAESIETFLEKKRIIFSDIHMRWLLLPQKYKNDGNLHEREARIAPAYQPIYDAALRMYAATRINKHIKSLQVDMIGLHYIAAMLNPDIDRYIGIRRVLKKQNYRDDVHNLYVHRSAKLIRALGAFYGVDMDGLYLAPFLSFPRKKKGKYGFDLHGAQETLSRLFNEGRITHKQHDLFNRLAGKKPSSYRAAAKAMGMGEIAARFHYRHVSYLYFSETGIRPPELKKS